MDHAEPIFLLFFLPPPISVCAVFPDNDYRSWQDDTNRSGTRLVFRDLAMKKLWALVIFVYSTITLPSVSFHSLDSGHQSMLILWQRMHVDMKSMLSWQYLTRDITQIRTWNITMVNTSHLCFCLS